MQPKPPRHDMLGEDSPWGDARCWECDNDAGVGQVVIWDGRVWHIACWPGLSTVDAPAQPVAEMRLVSRRG